MVRADSTAAFSTTRKNSSVRSLSIFSPKFLACGARRPSVGINTSCIKCDLGIYPLRSRDGSGGGWQVVVRFVWQARVAQTLLSANCVQRDGLQGVHRFRVRSRPYAELAPHRMSPFRTSRCQGTLPTSRYGRAGGLRGACRFLSRLLPRQGCQRNGSRKSGAVEESRIHIAPSPWRGIASPPMRDTNPVAKCGTTMVGFDPKSHTAAHRITLTQANSQAQAPAARELLLPPAANVLTLAPLVPFPRPP